MLEKFEVFNFMGFKDNLVFDFHTSKKYTYNTDLVQKSIIKKALVFGENSSGKSNLCYALMDIIFHLSDKEKISLPESVYLCANGDSTNAIFKYHFKFNGKSVLYEYAKNLRANCVMKSCITKTSLSWNTIISTFHIQL